MLAFLLAHWDTDRSSLRVARLVQLHVKPAEPLPALSIDSKGLNMRAQAHTVVTGRHARAMQIPPSVKTLAERSTPAEIRLDIQKLLQQEQLELAQALGDAGLSLHPKSEDMLGICALLAMSRGDWEESNELLSELQGVQGEQTPATTYWLLARCQRCMGDDNAATSILEEGLYRYPNSAELQAELTLMIKPEL
jgi:uncharacterized protein HemY